jgi:hypothetical protein
MDEREAIEDTTLYVVKILQTAVREAHGIRACSGRARHFQVIWSDGAPSWHSHKMLYSVRGLYSAYQEWRDGLTVTSAADDAEAREVPVRAPTNARQCGFSKMSAAGSEAACAPQSRPAGSCIGTVETVGELPNMGRSQPPSEGHASEASRRARRDAEAWRALDVGTVGDPPWGALASRTAVSGLHEALSGDTGRSSAGSPA